uniref:LRRNT domain-containing protein n=1 Tax=Panagrellus redivivus TaxID=6233 RepID=A0A7E5A1P4_PANRE
MVKLDLMNNELTELEPCTFCGLDNLRDLDMRNNKLTSIDGAFGTDRLTELNLLNNPLNDIPPLFFYGARVLKINNKTFIRG